MSVLAGSPALPEELPALANPLLFVTQFPVAADFATIGSTFGNHLSDVQSVGRGGDLYLRYPDGALCNLTRTAGFGEAGEFQGSAAIAVRDPSPHWDVDGGDPRALFSMVVGAPSELYEVTTEYWQIFEVSGLDACENTVVAKVPNQPEDYNNITPLYSPDGRILFSSDRPRNGERHLYPQLDEYETTATNTGLWSLDPTSGDLRLLNHAPSGVFTPFVDSFGRVIFTRWDHLQRDQQADADENDPECGDDDPSSPGYGTFDYFDESADAAKVDSRYEVFPEPRACRSDLLYGTNIVGLSINHFFPWQINPDGTGEETLNHVGRHELHSYFEQAFDDDANLVEFIADGDRHNPNEILNFFQIAEAGAQPGTYFGVEAPEFGTHASGQIVSIAAPPGLSADEMEVTYVTHPDTGITVDEGASPPATHSGHYRDPLPMSDGTLVAAHAAETRAAENEGSRAAPDPRYEFRLEKLVPGGGFLAAGASLTAGIARTLRFLDPDVEVSYSGELWELQPVELRHRPPPPLLSGPALEAPEAGVFSDEGVDVTAFRRYLAERDLAVIVSRDVTTRDDADRQQPFNLRVSGTTTQTLGAPGALYDVSYLQFFQADQVRGIGGLDDPQPGRRALARLMHDDTGHNPPSSGPEASVEVSDDGSMAAFVPARRALSWHLTAPDGTPLVRERYWLTFQPGEIRVCTSCHGLNDLDQAGEPPPESAPEALRALLRYWLANGPIFVDGFETGDTRAWSRSVQR